LQTYGANGWRIQNYLLESTAKQTEKTLEELKELTVEVNRDRKNTQVHASAIFLFSLLFKQRYVQDRLGKQLTSLETRWTELISSVLQIEMANVALDAEIERLNKKEAELAEL
jgi:pre-mRNA-splicing factor SPF27